MYVVVSAVLNTSRPFANIPWILARRLPGLDGHTPIIIAFLDRFPAFCLWGLHEDVSIWTHLSECPSTSCQTCHYCLGYHKYRRPATVWESASTSGVGLFTPSAVCQCSSCRLYPLSTDHPPSNDHVNSSSICRAGLKDRSASPKQNLWFFLEDSVSMLLLLLLRSFSEHHLSSCRPSSRRLVFLFGCTSS